MDNGFLLFLWNIEVSGILELPITSFRGEWTLNYIKPCIIYKKSNIGLRFAPLVRTVLVPKRGLLSTLLPPFKLNKALVSRALRERTSLNSCTCSLNLIGYYNNFTKIGSTKSIRWIIVSYRWFRNSSLNVIIKFGGGGGFGGPYSWHWKLTFIGQ